MIRESVQQFGKRNFGAEEWKKQEMKNRGKRENGENGKLVTKHVSQFLSRTFYCSLLFVIFRSMVSILNNTDSIDSYHTFRSFNFVVFVRLFFSWPHIYFLLIQTSAIYIFIPSDQY